jgi:hypothetical protein
MIWSACPNCSPNRWLELGPPVQNCSLHHPSTLLPIAGTPPCSHRQPPASRWEACGPQARCLSVSCQGRAPTTPTAPGRQPG